MIDNPYQDLLDKEPDFFNRQALQEGTAQRSGIALKQGEPKASEQSIIAALRTVEDPEIPVNLYDLGLIYNIEQQENGNVTILMTLTTPNCPVAGEIPKWVAEAVSKVDGVGIVEVMLTWTPKWTKNLMSDDAKIALDIL